MKFVCAGRLMFLANCRQFRPVKPIRQPYDGRPETPMNIGHLAILQTADKHIGGIADWASHPEDRTSLFMAPPAATDWLTSYRLRLDSKKVLPFDRQGPQAVQENTSES